MSSSSAKATGRVIASAVPLAVGEGLSLKFPQQSGDTFLIIGAVLSLIAVALIYHDRIPGIRISKVHRSFFDKETVYVRDLMNDDGLIADKTFVDCVIVGPAVLMAVGEGVHVDAPDFIVGPTDGPDSPVFVFATPGQKFIGYVPVKDSTFRRCHFLRVAIVSGTEQIKKMKADGKLIYREVMAEKVIRE